jgi:hypothetical protein
MYYGLTIFPIFVVSFLSWENIYPKTVFPLMELSDAQPIQFWPTDCSTYNQEEPFGVHRKCFEQPVNCDDEVVVQFTSNDISTNTEALVLPSLSQWLSSEESSNPDWTTGAVPEVTIPGSGGAGIASEWFYIDFTIVEGRNYTFQIDYTKAYNSGSSNPRTITIAFLNDDFTILASDSGTTPAPAGGSAQFDAELTGPALATRIGIRCNDGSNVTIQIDDISGTVSVGDEYVLSIRDENGAEILQLPFDSYDNGATFVYTLSLIPSETSPEICDAYVQFFIRNATTGTDQARSDALDIRQSHTGTILVTYYNHRNYAGLIYEDVSPQLIFYLRIPAVFYHERFPEEQEVMQLTDRLQTLNSVIRKQKMMDIDYVPYYFHEKIKLILNHQFVYINARYWVKEESYYIGSGDRRWPVKKASCWISQQDFVHRNVL